MALHIENTVIARLIRETTERTGESDETVIETALLEWLERLPAAAPEREAEVMTEERRERVYALVRDMQRRYKESGVNLPDHGDLLYDERGLPREGAIVYGEDGFAR